MLFVGLPIFRLGAKLTARKRSRPRKRYHVASDVTDIGADRRLRINVKYYAAVIDFGTDHTVAVFGELFKRQSLIRGERKGNIEQLLCRHARYAYAALGETIFVLFKSADSSSERVGGGKLCGDGGCILCAQNVDFYADRSIAALVLEHSAKALTAISFPDLAAFITTA